ncbi:SDR family oxidoreductase, partial [bacterium]|nr:SDR family oxidoreductase [bacterium]
MTLVQDFQKNIGVLEGPILIIGASGFIGANLLNGIFAVRGDVYGVVKGGKGWRLTDIPDDNIIAVDINDKNSVKNLIQSIKPKIVFDCKAYGAYSFETKKDQIYQTNFIGTVNLVEELADTGIRAYIHAGSSSEYGVNSEAPLEGSATLPNSDYAVSKVAVSEYLKFKGKLHNFPCVNLRLYSVYGPLEDPGRLVPTSIFQAIEGKFSSFVNPETTRDFVYVDDVCNAFALAATHMNPSIAGESLNIGTGKKTSIKDYAELIKKLFHVPGEPTFGSMHARSWDLPNWYSNSSKASETLDWVAKTE